MARRRRHNGDVDDLTALAMAAKAGDREALTTFVRRSQPIVWRFCASLGSPDTADDLTQDTYLRAVGALARFRGDSSATTWLLSIARRVVADSIRQSQRDRALTDRLTPAGPAAAATGHVDVMLLLAELPYPLREAFVLTQLLGLGYTDAAEAAGCPVGTIRSRVSRARERLVSMTADDEHDGISGSC